MPTENRVGNFLVTCSAYSSACQEHVGTKLSHENNYWGNYGHFLFPAVRGNKSVFIKDRLLFTVCAYA